MTGYLRRVLVQIDRSKGRRRVGIHVFQRLFDLFIQHSTSFGKGPSFPFETFRHLLALRFEIFDHVV